MSKTIEEIKKSYFGKFVATSNAIVASENSTNDQQIENLMKNSALIMNEMVDEGISNENLIELMRISQDYGEYPEDFKESMVTAFDKLFSIEDGIMKMNVAILGAKEDKFLTQEDAVKFMMDLFDNEDVSIVEEMTNNAKVFGSIMTDTLSEKSQEQMAECQMIEMNRIFEASGDFDSEEENSDEKLENA